MPGLIVERPKMSLQMHETLKRYILKERKKKKDEDVAHEEKLREEQVGIDIQVDLSHCHIGHCFVLFI
jgi:hypothetical protein